MKSSAFYLRDLSSTSLEMAFSDLRGQIEIKSKRRAYVSVGGDL